MQAGDDVTITQNGVPVAALIPIRVSVRRPINRGDLIELLRRHQPDETLAADLARLTGDTTDDLGPVR